MCEKPLTLTVAETKECYDLAKQNNRILFCAYNRYCPKLHGKEPVD